MTREMKDSGIEWIGQIPKDWKVNRLKFVSSFINGDRGSNYPNANDLIEDGVIFITSNNIHKTKLDSSPFLSKYITKEKYKSLGGAKVKVGDIIFCLRGSVGMCAINATEKTGTIASSLVDIRPTKINSYYLNYSLQSTINTYQTFLNTNGSCAANLSAEDVSNYYFIEPPAEEQKQIVAYLNIKCSHIDTLLSQIQEQVDTLEQYKESVITEAVTNGLHPDVEMKDSGIEWIGKIPKQWDVIKIKHTSLLKGRIGWQGLRTDEYLEDENLPYLITGTDFNDGKIKWEKCAHVSEERYKIDKNIHIFENDLLITKDGTIGKLAIVTHCPQKVCLNSGVLLIRNVGEYKYNKRYLYYVLSSNQFIKWFNLSNSGNSTIKHLNQEKFYEFSYTYPKLSEQLQIVDYLDKKCSQIDSIISDKKKQLETLEQYKKSLIYEYVTGKKEILNA